jgi:hypothetical protein
MNIRTALQHSRAAENERRTASGRHDEQQQQQSRVPIAKQTCPAAPDQQRTVQYLFVVQKKEPSSQKKIREKSN